MSYKFLSLGIDPDTQPPAGNWSSGPSFDGKGTFETQRMTPRGAKPDLGMASPSTAAQSGQMAGADGGPIKKAGKAIKDALS